MSLSSILSQIQRKGKPIIRNENQKPESESKEVNPTRKSPASEPNPKPVDPVVARLKALRKAEIEKKEMEKQQKRGNAPKKIASTIPIRKGPVKKAAPTSKTSNKQTTPIPTTSTSSEPKKKMKFNELMKKAQSIDQSKLAIAIKQKSSKTANVGESVNSKATSRSSVKPSISTSASLSSARGRNSTTTNKRNIDQPTKGVTETKASSKPSSNSTQSRAPIPIRKPSSALEKKLTKRKPQAREEDYEEDSDMDDFVVDDEEENTGAIEEVGYDRDEIWAMFNRGRKRSYYDFDDDSADDMEATGAEILEEERRSKIRAEREDRKEWEEEQRRAAEKRARKLKKI